MLMRKNIVKIHYIPLAVIGVAAIALVVGLTLTLMQKTAPATNNVGEIYAPNYEVSANNGQPTSFVIRIKPGTKVDTVTATLEYNPADLEYVEADYSGSPFTTQIPAIKSGSTVTMQLALMGGGSVSGDSLIATMKFKSKKDGNHAVKLTAGNAAYNGVSTHPLVAGIAASSTNPNCRGANCVVATTAGQQGQDAKNDSNDSKASLHPVAQALTALGLPGPTSTRAAPWITGIVICIVMAGVIGAYWMIAKHKNFWPYGKKPIKTQGDNYDDQQTGP